ncbi:MAG: flagellar biosynthesis anti-sigma factor FlgM [Clostridiales bacterium]|nr:flagellar biosynthesis anti-sigma factor FlgM [Clostridiales bacterium]
MIKNSGLNTNLPSLLSAKRAEQLNTQNLQQNAAKLNKVAAPCRTDTIEISQNRTDNRPAVSKLRDQIMSDLSSDKDTAFLSALKEKINAGQYKPDSGEIADSMLTGRK